MSRYHVRMTELLSGGAPTEEGDVAETVADHEGGFFASAAERPRRQVCDGGAADEQPHLRHLWEEQSKPVTRDLSGTWSLLPERGRAGECGVESNWREVASATQPRMLGCTQLSSENSHSV